jgi:hypothetical protein
MAGRIALLALAATLIFSVRCASQSDPSDDLNRKLSTHVAMGQVQGTFVEVLGQTARAFNIPMGISWVKTASSQRDRAVQYKDATVREIIEDIARTEPGYEVRIENNVVHVATKDIPDRQNFLTLRIPQFAGSGVANVVKGALWILLNQQIAPNPPKSYAAGIPFSPSDLKLDLQFTNATVEEILDRIALASDQKVWIVTFEDDATLISTGFRRTESLDSKEAPSDDAEPVWDIFTWNHWPLAAVPAPAEPPQQ